MAAEESAIMEETPVIAEDSFSSSMIPDEVFEMMQGKSWKDGCPVSREDLRYLRLLYVDLDGNEQTGEMICHKIIAEDLLEIFRELYEQRYPIEKIRLVDEYDADDEASMTDNNTSCFNYRMISYTDKVSKHGYGVAVDINPLYNPYTKTVNGVQNIEPAAGWPYLDRAADFPCKITDDDLCFRLFTEHGFTWGGYWTYSKDYQHFELPDERMPY